MDREGVEYEDDVEVHSPNEVGDGEASDCPAAGVDGDNQVQEATSASLGSIVTRWAPGRIVKINKKLSTEQRAAVEDLGFGSLLDMSQTKIRRKLCKKLVDCYVLKENVIKIDGKEILWP